MMPTAEPLLQESVGASYSIDIPIAPGLTVSLHFDEKGKGYEIYATFGSLTTQKQYIGRDGGCATFGTADVLGSHAQVQGCLKLNPVRFEGKAEACAFGSCTSKTFSLPLS
jgi:hypothetical protein